MFLALMLSVSRTRHQTSSLCSGCPVRPPVYLGTAWEQITRRRPTLFWKMPVSFRCHLVWPSWALSQTCASCIPWPGGLLGQRCRWTPCRPALTDLLHSRNPRSVLFPRSLGPSDSRTSKAHNQNKVIRYPSVARLRSGPRSSILGNTGQVLPLLLVGSSTPWNEFLAKLNRESRRVLIRMETRKRRRSSTWEVFNPNRTCLSLKSRRLI